MDPRRAAVLLATGAGLGLVAQLLFFAVPLGINVVLMIAALLCAGWITRRPGTRLDPIDAWLPLGAVVLAAFVAVRTDPVLVTLDTFGAVAFAGASVAALGGVRVTRCSAAQVVLLAGELIAGAIASAGPLIAAVNRGYQPGSALRRSSPAAGVLRGIAISLPVLALFALLFAAADAIFARAVGDLFTLGIDFGEVAGRTSYGVVAGWLCAGLLAAVAVGTFAATRPAPEVDGAGDAADATPGVAPSNGWRLGNVEAIIVVAGVDLLFAWFVVIQATYLFGGRDTLEASGLTYSDYARRGFFELVAVAVLAGLLLVLVDALVARRTRLQLAASLALCVLTAVVLASALIRLMLYQQAYGWTELRFYVLAAIVWLALGIVATAGGLVARRTRWLPQALASSALAVTIAVNIVGPQGFIASQNVARALDPSLVPPDGQSGLDAAYLADLGYDAVPVVAEAVDRLSADDREALEVSLALRLWLLDRDAGSTRWQAWNLARERARSALDGRRDELPRVEEKFDEWGLRYNP